MERIINIDISIFLKTIMWQMSLKIYSLETKNFDNIRQWVV